MAKKGSYIGIFFLFLMVFGLYFSSTASNGFCLGDYILNQVGLKAWQNNEEKLGLRYTFFYALILVIIGWKGATKYLKDSHPLLIKKLPWIFFGLLIFVVPATTELAKNTYYSFQPGVNAIEYDAKSSNCYVDLEEEGQWVAGTIVLTNHSSKEISLYVKLVDRKYFTEDVVLKDEQNEFVFKIHPKEKTFWHYKFSISEGKTKIQSGKLIGPAIELMEINSFR